MRRSSSDHSRHKSSTKSRVRAQSVGPLPHAVQHLGQPRFELPSTLRNHDPAVEKHSAELVDKGRPLAEEPGASPVQDLASAWASLFSSTNRTVGVTAASAILSASRSSFFCAFT